MIRKKTGRVAPWLIVAVFVCWLYSLPFYVTSGYHVGVAFVIFVNVVLAASFRLTVKAGLFSMAQNAFAIVAAFTAGYLSRYVGAPFYLAVLAGGAAAVLLALVVGGIVLRVKGVYFAIVTMAVGEIALMSFVTYWPVSLGGSIGIMGVIPPKVTIGSLELVFASRASFYYLILSVSLLCLLALWWIERCRIGLILEAIRQEEDLVQAIGVRVFRYKLFALVAQALFTGIVASMLIFTTFMVSPYDYTASYIIRLIAGTVLGGVGSFAGPLVGSSVMVFLDELLRRAGPLYDVMVMGAIIMMVMLFMPQGLVGTATQRASWRARLSTRRKNLWDRLRQARSRLARGHRSEEDTSAERADPQHL